MKIADAQGELRSAFMGGFVGQLVSALIWTVSALLSLWLSPQIGKLALFLGGTLIFPLTLLGLRLIGHTEKLSPENSLNQLAAQIAMTVPVGFLLVWAASLARESWFYPAAMIVVGAHYFPFVFLYGMKHFAILGGLMCGTAMLIGVYLRESFTLGAWISIVLFVVFALIGRWRVLTEESRRALGHDPSVGYQPIQGAN